MTAPRLLPLVLAAFLAGGTGALAGYTLRGAELAAIDPGLIGADPTPGPSAAPNGTDNDGTVEIRIDADGKLLAEGLTFAERVGTLQLVILDEYPGYLQFAIERDYGDGNFIVVYSDTFPQGVTGFAPLTVEQPGSYRISAIPGDPPLVASTATLAIAEPAAP